MTQDFIGKANKALASARLLLNAGDSDGACNRAYYAMFDAAIAALVWVGAATADKPPRTHNGLLGAFGLHLVQTGELSVEFGRSLNRLQELRRTGDYLSAPVPTDRTERAVQEAETFVTGVHQPLARSRR